MANGHATYAINFRCPHCRAICRSGGMMNGPPVPGDWALCAGCATFSVLLEGLMSGRRVRPAEWKGADGARTLVCVPREAWQVFDGQRRRREK